MNEEFRVQYQEFIADMVDKKKVFMIEKP